jgi:membrane protein EpsK
LTLNLGLFDTSLLKEMLGFSGWVLVNQIGSLLFLNIDLIAANLIFGAKVAGQYGTVLIFPTALRSLVGTVNAVLIPIVFAQYAQNDLARLVRLVRLSVKFIGLALALPIGLLCGLGKPLLAIWLGPDFTDLSWLVVVLVGHLCINVAVVPLFSIQVATNNVRLPGILTLVTGALNVILAVLLPLWSGWGYISIAVAGAVVLTLKNAIFTPLYNARILKVPWWTFLSSLIGGVVGCIGIGIGTYWISSVLTLSSWLRLGLVAAVISGIYAVAAYYWGLEAEDRTLLISEIQQRMQR